MICSLLKVDIEISIVGIAFYLFFQIFYYLFYVFGALIFGAYIFTFLYPFAELTPLSLYNVLCLFLQFLT